MNQGILLEKGKTVVSMINIGSMLEALREILVLCMIIALLLGCGDPNLGNPKVREKIWAKAIDVDSLQDRRRPSGEELRYAPNQERPYNGWVKDGLVKISDEIYQLQKLHGSSIIGKLYQFHNGKRHGTYIQWYINQQNSERGTFLNGRRNGMWTEWYENGQKRNEGSYKEGWKEGMWTEWYENGQKRNEGSYKEGWKEGMWTEWSMNGQIQGKGFYTKGYIENGGSLKPQEYSGKDDYRDEMDLTPLEEEKVEQTLEFDN